MTTFLAIVLIFAVLIGFLVLRGYLQKKERECKDYPSALQGERCRLHKDSLKT